MPQTSRPTCGGSESAAERETEIQRYSKRGRASEKQEELKAGHTWLFPLWLEAHETAGTEAGGGDRKWRWPTPAAALPALIKFLSEVFQQEMVL